MTASNRHEKKASRKQHCLLPRARVVISSIMENMERSHLSVLTQDGVGWILQQMIWILELPNLHIISRATEVSYLTVPAITQRWHMQRPNSLEHLSSHHVYVAKRTYQATQVINRPIVAITEESHSLAVTKIPPTVTITVLIFQLRVAPINLIHRECYHVRWTTCTCQTVNNRLNR